MATSVADAGAGSSSPASHGPGSLCAAASVATANFSFEDLPWSLHMMIFSFLPLRDVFRARGVCRIWNTLIVSEEFRRLWRPSHQESCLVLSQVTSREYDRLDYWYAPQCYGDKHWLEVWQPSSGVRTRISSVGSPKVSMSGFEILASSEGLVCGNLQGERRYSLVVGNPLTCEWRKLPPVPTNSHSLVIPKYTRLCALMLMDSHSSSAGCSHYKIALFPGNLSPIHLAHPPQQYFWLLIYHSRDDHWECAPQFEWSSSCCFMGTILPGFPFVFKLSHHYRNPLGISVYDTTSRSWNAVGEAQLPELDDELCLAYRAFPYRESCIVITVGVEFTSMPSLVYTALALEAQGKVSKTLCRMSTGLNAAKWCSEVGQRELCECPFRLVMEGNFVVVCLNSDLDVLPLMAYNLEISEWTRMQEVYHRKYKYAGSCTLSPSLSAVP